VIPACREYGLGVIPWSPVAEGLLAGAWDRATSGRRAAEHLKRRGEKNRARIEAYERFCEERGQAPAVVAVAWLLHQPGVTAPIVGPRTMSHLEDALKAETLVLSPEDLKRLDEIFPGPAGPAPEAYAW
jgi:aryl-alcohol dehydrogenase-like predicted oxidoreductase